MRRLFLTLSIAFSVLVTQLSANGSSSFSSAGRKKKATTRPPRISKRVTPEMIRSAQQRLIDLGYWIGDADGRWGEASRFGLIAFQKIEGRPRTGRLTPAELAALSSASRPNPREKGYSHIEVDLTRQVLFVVGENGLVSRILPVSSGNGKLFTVEGYTQPAITPTGRFRVFRKLEGWRKSDLGLLYYPNYIVGGIAIHGNPEVPVHAASHGCIRIPMFASVEFSEMTPIGTQVIVYGEGPPRENLPKPD